MENQKYKSEIWDDVQKMIEEEAKSPDFCYKNKPKQWESLLKGVQTMDSYVAKYCHLPSVSSRKIGCEDFANETFNVGLIYSGSKSKATTPFKKEVYSKYEIYPTYEEFTQLYNAACMQDYTYENGHLPPTTLTHGGMEHKGVNIGQIMAKFRNHKDSFSEKSLKLVESVVDGVPMISEYNRGAD
ncbi:MAG: hypothetical protein FWE45_03530 [Firmicutes bacterium]|nr:hypothetical protein [Bacillota bacterium]